MWVPDKTFESFAQAAQQQSDKPDGKVLNRAASLQSEYLEAYESSQGNSRFFAYYSLWVLNKKLQPFLDSQQTSSGQLVQQL